jgi:hypothetical protein
MYYLKRNLKKWLFIFLEEKSFEYLLNESKDTFNKYIEGADVE